MKNTEPKREKDMEDIVSRAAVIAIAIGALVTIFLVLETSKESYSALYIKPGSYSNYMEDNKVSFTYGVQCFENARTQYTLQVLVNDNLITEKEFALDGRGKTVEDDVSFDLPPGTGLPAKVSVALNANNQNYETHYWIKGRK
jgi:hypothetical protein